MKIDPALLPLLLKARCGRTRKIRALPLARELLRLTAKARREGILALEEAARGSSEEALRAFLGMTVDGEDASVLDDALLLRTAGSDLRGEALFRLLLVWSAARLIQEGASPRTVALYFIGLFGSDADLLQGWEDSLAAAKAQEGDELSSGWDEADSAGNATADGGAAPLATSLTASAPVGRLGTIRSGYNPLNAEDRVLLERLRGDPAERLRLLRESPQELASRYFQVLDEPERAHALRSLYEELPVLSAPLGGPEAIELRAGLQEKIRSLYDGLGAEGLASLESYVRERDPGLLERMRADLMSFPSMATLDDAVIQRVIRGSSRADLAMALHAESSELVDAFLRNMSKNAARELTEDMRDFGPVRLSEVLRAQGAILDLLKKLEDSGEIALGGEASIN